MPRVSCDSCGRELISSNPDAEHFCPDCAGDGPSHSAESQHEQARAADANYHRQRVIDNAVNQGGSL